MSNLISKTIPIPDRKRNASKLNNLPIHKLQVGESVKIVDITNLNSCEYVKTYSKFNNAVYRNISQRGIPGAFKIGVHKTKSKKELRVWRTS